MADKERVAQAYTYLRGLMPDGKLTQAQVAAGDLIISSCGLDVFTTLIRTVQGTTNIFSKDISATGYAIIKQFEGFKAQAYKDTGGVWTIGFGTTKYPNGVAVKQGDTCTTMQAEAWLMNDCAWVDKCLDDHIKVTVTQNQFDALASFVYNVGATAFVKSTLLRRLNAGEMSLAANEFDRWVNDNGKRIKGLVVRREQEKKLFLAA